MSDQTIKTLFYFILFLLSIYPLIDLLFKKHKLHIRLLIAALIVFFWVIAIEYKSVTDGETLVAANKADSLNKEARRLASELKMKTDSTNYYIKALKDSLKTLNVSEDKRKLFNNYIDKVNTLNQY